MLELMFTSAVPLILTALGGLISERAGVLNIALEACIGIGAFTTAVLIAMGVPLGGAIFATMMVGILAGALLGFVHLGLGANLFIAGLGINFLLPSISGLISQSLFAQRGVIRINTVNLSLFAWLLIPVGFLVWGIVMHSAYGRRLRAAGSGGNFLAERGISIQSVQMSALMISSGMAALAGALLALRIGAFVSGISAGKGWIALVLIWMGFRNPMGIVLSGYIFTIFEIVANKGQGFLAGNASLMLALPYLAALFALIVSSLHRGEE